jgi:hypothetical protein
MSANYAKQIDIFFVYQWVNKQSLAGPAVLKFTIHFETTYTYYPF